MRYQAAHGSPYPLGATWDGAGVNFALFSENAEAVDLCLFDQPSGTLETSRIPLLEQTDYVWHTYLPDARPGLIYGYRVHGPWRPQDGHRFNPNKLLLDPYAKAVTGRIQWSDAMFSYPIGGGDDRDLIMDTTDSAPGMPKALVVEPAFTWGDDRPPNVPWHDTIIYEAHTRGLTQLNEEIPTAIRGTYRGLSDPNVIAYLQRMGITAVEIMPVHHFVNDRHLVERGLVNFWGYNSLGFFAPDTRYRTTNEIGGQVAEFKSMVKNLHRAGIEVILDVVYNHTAEGNHLGPTLSFRGIDNAAYYRLTPENRRYYVDYTGTGNTLNMLHPRTVQLVMDSLRYWILEMHVDGFRFDLASALARGLHAVDRLSAFFEIIHQDPVISQVKLIAEPWDVGEGGYQVGNFPVLWAEWNGRYRDTVRRFWRGDHGQVGDLAYRLTGSSDLYEWNGKRPYASINFVTAHDGFTMRDLVSYNEKHNEANGEDNRDGSNDNLSWNCGEEGPTDNPEIEALRMKQWRNFMTTLLVSQGVPMILYGDEAGRTQHGNNNVYCQDNELSWLSWKQTPERREMLAWTRRVIAFRKAHPVLRRRGFFQGRPIRGAGTHDIIWLRHDGRTLRDQDWNGHALRSFGMLLAGAASDLVDDFGRPVIDETLLLIFNNGDSPTLFRLPDVPGGDRWALALDTARPEKDDGWDWYRTGRRYPVQPRSIAILRHATAASAPEPD